MKSIFNLSLILTLIIGSASESLAQNKIKWISWEEALAAQKIEKKKILVDIYTDWCTWCKKMDKASNPTHTGFSG